MSLLEAKHNVNPASGLSKELAIVDDTALESEGDAGEVFVDGGTTGSNQISVYIVHKGDTLAGIAKMFGVTTNTLLWANDIKGGKVSEGDEIVILPISGVKHTVKSGDTLASIAKKYKADLDDVLAYNGLPTGAKLKVGDVVIVPDGEITAVTSSGSGSIGKIISGVKTLGYFIRPVNGAKKTQGIHGHNGVDLGAPIGTNVMAAADGKVILARSGWNGGYGNYIVVSHANGTQTLYAHLSRINVSTGQQVSQGQSIGAVGNTGKSSGPHLHIEVRGGTNPF